MINLLRLSHFWTRFLFTSALGVLCFNTHWLLAEQRIEFSHAEPLSRRVETRIEIKGELKLLNPAESSPEEVKDKVKQAIIRIPVSGTAQLRYQERLLAEKEKTLLNHGLRKYEVANAKLQVGKGEVKNELAENHAIIVIRDTHETTAVFSPNGALVRDELELLTNACDGGLLVHLLPEKAAVVGESWRPSSDLLARLLRLEVVSESEITVKFNRVENNVAILDIAGKAAGGIDGIESDIEISGKLNYDLSTKLCTWFAATLKENRAASQGSPGFETTSRIRVSLEKCDLPAELADDALPKLKLTPDAATRLLRYTAVPANFEFVYEPQWHVVSDQPDLVVLRYVERGELIAQCNLSSLAPLGKGEQLTLEGYQTHLKRSLGSSFREFIEAGESVNENGVRVLRVVASGMLVDVPLHWVFYHLSDDHNHRVTLAFTMDADNAAKFGRAEETLISSLYFTGKTETAQKPAASKTK